MKVLARCRAHGVTLNAEKFVLAAPKVRFCGYQLSHDGIAADPEKVRAITDFAKPANLTDLRSFMGLANQLAEFSPDISCAAAPLPLLMSPKRMFVWTADHDQAFQKAQRGPYPVHLSLPPSIQSSRPSCRQTLHVYTVWDTLSYRITAEEVSDSPMWLTLLNDPRPATPPSSWSYWQYVGDERSRFFPRGAFPHFGLVTDHRPLVPILNNYSLDAIATLVSSV
ncbi:Retrovirus-related Pol polyprotein from transposon opus [Chionoecetes opilio]|uniref:Retrovirus-related Pol polyprotein from transposon opus n=1 Tax=Chionoecetes opilio TaxID=41210 RepID=A0A8J5CLM4_CHIOP|nr:Retrovirus-related Pol polyprotein from transposon opus [Chionoecetes opilio]